MKRLLPLLLFVSIVFPQKEYNIKQIIEQDSIYYKKFSDKVVNGRIYEMHDDMKVSLGKIKDGKKDGKWTEWYDNGRKKLESNWKNGKKYGLWMIYMEDGWKLNEIKYTDDDNYEYKNYNKNGSLNYSGAFKDGKIFSGVVESFKKTTMYFSPFDANVVIDSDTMIHNHYENGEIMKMVYLDYSTKDTVKVEDCTKGECEEVKDESKEGNNNDDTHLSLIIDKKLPEADNCQNNNFIGVQKIKFEDEQNLIPYDSPYPMGFWLELIGNLVNSGAAYIILNSEVCNIKRWYYEDIVKQYPNVYQTVKNSSTSYSTDFCPDKIGDIGEYPLALIIDTEDFDLSDPMEDIDWMGQFIPGEIPDWIQAIDDLDERREMMEIMGVSAHFDITKSPFNKQVVLIGF